MDQLAQITQRVQDVILAVSAPTGFIFTLGGVILIALKLMTQHNNPNKRVETITGLPWLAGASIILGSALLITNIIISLGKGQ
jgi:hypothetical protein